MEEVQSPVASQMQRRHRNSSVIGIHCLSHTGDEKHSKRVSGQFRKPPAGRNASLSYQCGEGVRA